MSKLVNIFGIFAFFTTLLILYEYTTYLDDSEPTIPMMMSTSVVPTETTDMLQERIKYLENTLVNMVSKVNKSVKSIRNVEESITGTTMLLTYIDGRWRMIDKFQSDITEVFDSHAPQIRNDFHGHYIKTSQELKERLDKNRCTGFRPGVAMCSRIRDENNYLQEWITFNLVIGFSHVYLYNHSRNRNPQRTVTVLQPFIEAGVVTIVPYPAPTQNYVFTAPQHCLETYGSLYDWIALFDSDEYMFVKEDNHNCVTTFLDNYKDYGGLVLNWGFFGASGHIKTQAHKLTLGTYSKRWPSNPHVKSIVQPSRVDPNQFLSFHYAIYRPPYYGVNTAKDLVPEAIQDPPKYDVAVLNHYWSRSFEEWMIKTQREYEQGMRRSWLEFYRHDRDCTVNDTDIWVKWGTRMKAMLQPQ